MIGLSPSHALFQTAAYLVLTTESAESTKVPGLWKGRHNGLFDDGA